MPGASRKCDSGDAGRVSVSTNSAAYLQERHQLPPEHLAALAAVEAIADAAAAATTS